MSNGISQADMRYLTASLDRLGGGFAAGADRRIRTKALDSQIESQRARDQYYATRTELEKFGVQMSLIKLGFIDQAEADKLTAGVADLFGFDMKITVPDKPPEAGTEFTFGGKQFAADGLGGWLPLDEMSKGDQLMFAAQAGQLVPVRQAMDQARDMMNRIADPKNPMYQDAKQQFDAAQQQYYGMWSSMAELANSKGYKPVSPTQVMDDVGATAEPYGPQQPTAAERAAGAAIPGSLKPAAREAAQYIKKTAKPITQNLPEIAGGLVAAPTLLGAARGVEGLIGAGKKFLKGGPDQDWGWDSQKRRIVRTRFEPKIP